MPANQLITPQMITYKCLAELLNNLKVVTGFNTEWAREFGIKGQKIGDTLKIRKPQRWFVQNGALFSPQPIVDTFATATIDRHKHIGFQWGAVEATLSIDDAYDRYFKTSINALANFVDSDAANWAYLNTADANGILGTDPTSLATAQAFFIKANAILKAKGADVSTLRAAVAPMTAAEILPYLNTNFNPTGAIGAQYMKGELANAFGFVDGIAVDQNMYRHTAGTYTGTPVLASAVVSGDTSLATSGWTAGDTLNPGDILAFKGATAALSYFEVNPENRRSFGRERRIVVGGSAVLTADGGGLMTIPLGGSDSLLGPESQYQNVDVLPASGAALVVWPGTTTPSGLSGTQSIAFSKGAFAFCPITIQTFDTGVMMAQATDPDTGISITMTRQFNAQTYQEINRLDIAYGFANLYNLNEAIRLVGA